MNITKKAAAASLAALRRIERGADATDIIENDYDACGLICAALTDMGWMRGTDDEALFEETWNKRRRRFEYDAGHIAIALAAIATY